MREPVPVVTNAYTPKETIELCGRMGVAKANTRIDKVFISSVTAGILLSFAGAILLVVNASPWFKDDAPGLLKIVGGMLFPLGFIMVVTSGTDLCTGSFVITTMAVLQKRLSVLKMLQHWFITFWGNLAGSLFVVAIIAGYGGVFSEQSEKEAVFTFNRSKIVTPMWHNIFLGAIGCNWLVSMACFFAFMAREYISKVAAIWWPIFAFVALGFDHVVANMFLIPMAIFLKDPEVTVGLYIWKSVIPALLGNIIGGVVVAVTYWYLHLTGEGPVPIDGIYFGNDQEKLLRADSGAHSDASSDRKEERSPEKMV